MVSKREEGLVLAKMWEFTYVRPLCLFYVLFPFFFIFWIGLYARLSKRWQADVSYENSRKKKEEKQQMLSTSCL